MFRSTGGSTRGREREIIRFGSYNIRNGRKRGLKLALRRMSQANLDLDIFQETKTTDGVYTCWLDGYRIFSTDVPSRHRVRVAFFY